VGNLRQTIISAFGRVPVDDQVDSLDIAKALQFFEDDRGRKLGVKLKSQEVRSLKDIEGAFAELSEQHPDVLLVVQDALTLEYRKEIIEFALRNRLPSMFVTKEWVEEGGLLSYGDRPPERYRRAADIVDKVLRGTKPSNIPVEQPKTFELAVNVKTAKAIGLTLSPAFLARADLAVE
jgi:putative ABC transport system substrate-binding protein